MAKRFHIPFTSLNGEPWRYEIHDADHVGASTEINGSPEGFYFNYEGQNTKGPADMFTPVLASSSTFNMKIEDATMDNIIDDILSSREGRFHTVIYRNSSVYWVGLIVADELRQSDQYYPFNLSIFSIDGISRLNEIEYKNPTTGVKYSGRQTAIQHFYNVIDILGMDSIVSMPTAYFQTNFNWYSDSMSTGSGNNGLTQFDIDHVIFQQKDNKGNEILWNTYDVLTALCRALGGRFYMCEGRWWFMQSGEYKDTTQEQWQFDNTGTQTAYIAAQTFDKDINYTNRWKINGGSFTSLRAMKTVIVDYNHQSGMNRAEGLAWDETGPAGFIELPGQLGIPASYQAQASIKIPFVIYSTYQVLNPAHTYKPHQYIFKLTIKAGTEYLAQSGNNATEWTSLTSTITISTNFITEALNQVPTTYLWENVTDYIPTSMDGDNFEVKIELEKVVDQSGTTIVEGVHTDYVAFFFFDVNQMELSVLEEGSGTGPSLDIQRHTFTDNTAGNTGIYKIDTYIGDGPLPFSLTRLTDGTDNTENWAVGSTSGVDPISTLLAKQILNLRQTSSKVFQGTYMASDFHPYSRAVDFNKGFIPTRLRFNAWYDQWEGDFVQVQTGVYSGVVTPPYTPGTGNTGSPVMLPQIPPIVVPDGGDFGTGNLVSNNANNTSPTTINNSTGLVAGSGDPSGFFNITIDPVNYSFVKQGDTVQLVHPINGYFETFTVTTTPQPNATTLELTGTTIEDFPLGTFIKVTPAAIYNRGFQNINWDFTGTVWPIPTTVGILPQETDVGQDEMVRRLVVHRGGIRIYYSPSGTPKPNAFYVTADRVIFHQKCINETVHLEVLP